MHEALLAIIEKQLPVTEKDTGLCRACFEPVYFPKNSLPEKAGKVPQYLYFIVSGYLRLFHVDANGDEVTTHINCPPGFMTAYSAFNNATPAADHLQCITNCTLLRISKAGLDRLMLESETFRAFSTQVFEQSIAYNENRARELATLTAAQRYRNLLHRWPGIVQHVPLQYIASFLGMNAKSLSRIRKQIV